jgi:pimeloyl-ACP methyl ester carboxylesterase
VGTTGAQPFDQVTIDGVAVELAQAGEGPHLLFLHSVDGIDPDARWFELLSERFHVIAPWHPGFGHSELPAEFRTIGDLALFYLQLIDALEIHDATVVGASFGGWLAAEIAVRTCAPFARLALVDPLGIKVGDRTSRDIADVFAISQEELTARAYHDPARRTRDYSTMSERELLAIARSREAYTYFGWRPYMHDPSLKRWLRRIRIPTLVVWGASDRIVSREYGRAYAAEIPDARFELIEEAGHYPLTEQPDRTVELLVEFAGQSVPLATAS